MTETYQTGTIGLAALTVAILAQVQAQMTATALETNIVPVGVARTNAGTSGASVTGDDGAQNISTRNTANGNVCVVRNPGGNALAPVISANKAVPGLIAVATHP